MIHADSVKAWEAESETFRGIIAEQRIELSRLFAQLVEAQAELKEMRTALQAVVIDVLEYERVNNLAPNPGKKDCWQSITRARELLHRGEP